MADQGISTTEIVLQGFINPVRALAHLLKATGAPLSPTFYKEVDDWAAVCNELVEGEPGFFCEDPHEGVDRLIEASGRDIVVVGLRDGLHIMGRAEFLKRVLFAPPPEEHP